MGEMKEVVMDADVAEASEPNGNVVAPVLTHNAISLCHIPGEGWSLIKIQYNPITGDVGKPVKSRTGEGLAYIKERFKIDTVNPTELEGLDIFNNSGNKW